MRVVLYGLSLVAIAYAAFVLREGKSVLHEIEGLVMVLTAAVLFVGGTASPAPAPSWKAALNGARTAGAAVGLAVVVLVAGTLIQRLSTTSSAPSIRVSIQESKPVVFEGDSEWVAAGIGYPGDALRSQRGPERGRISTNQYAVVRFRVKNLGDSPRTVERHPRLATAGNRKLDPIEQQELFVPEDAHSLGVGETLQPGIAREFFAVYEFPADDRPTSLLFWRLDGRGDPATAVFSR
jgi:hypothetical protein